MAVSRSRTTACHCTTGRVTRSPATPPARTSAAFGSWSIRDPGPRDWKSGVARSFGAMLQPGRGKKGLRAMPTPTRAPVVRYLLAHASSLRALEQLADYVNGLPEVDERLLVIATLAVRDGEFVPGPATQHAL